MFMGSKILVLLVIFAYLQATAANTARTCNACNGINCQRTTLNVTQKCIDPLDYCVTIFDKFNVLRAGCASEIPIELRRRCDRNSIECHKCNADRCNNLGQAEFQCLECDSSKDANCVTNPMKITPNRCAKPTAPNSYCFVKVENGVTKRGCATAVIEQENCFVADNCMLCMPGDVRYCNNVNFTPSSPQKTRWFLNEIAKMKL